MRDSILRERRKLLLVEGDLPIGSAMSCCATLYCDEEPVPLSPMMASFTESGLLGSVTSWAATAATPASSAASEMMTRDCRGMDR